MKLCFFMKILELFLIYAWILIAHSSSILRNIWLNFSLKCTKRYILRYQFIELGKNAKRMMLFFNGCSTKSPSLFLTSITSAILIGRVSYEAPSHGWFVCKQNTVTFIAFQLTWLDNHVIKTSARAIYFKKVE